MELGFPYTSHVRGKIRELRCRAKNQHRVFYFAAVGRQMALLHAFTKKTAKAPDHELQIAERRMSDFTQRLGQEPEKSR